MTPQQIGHRAGEYGFGVVLQHEDSAMRRDVDTPRGGPTAPGVVQKHVILSVVGHENPPVLSSGEELFVVSR
ncbi:MAG TPA: hypothetical protein VHL09_02095, partial [Dehalococcoidia bacterium]|nr:hypothetical protein [Dehalococcoidia bacterium]